MNPLAESMSRSSWKCCVANGTRSCRNSLALCGRLWYNDHERTATRDLGGSWWEFGLGTNLNFGKDSHFYLDVEKSTNGDVTTPWQWNVGFRVAY